MSELKWYVVRAVSGKEKKVKQYIDAEISRLGFSHLVPQVLIPMEKYYQMKDGKKIAKIRLTSAWRIGIGFPALSPKKPITLLIPLIICSNSPSKVASIKTVY